MTYEDEKLLRFWAAGPDNDNYCRVAHEFGYNRAKARREVRATLRSIGWYPHTSDEFQDVRQRIRQGDLPGFELL